MDDEFTFCQERHDKRLRKEKPMKVYLIFCLSFIFGCDAPILTKTVERVINGDTIELSDGTRIRYLGINTPEKDEPLWEEATELNRALVEGKTVRLKYDKKRTGRYGRTLAYVFLLDDTFVNCEFLRVGLAEIATYQQTLKLLDILIECQWEALSNRQGIWIDAIVENIVYTTATGDKYHKAGCRYLTESAIPTTIERAIKNGFAPSSICFN